MFLPILRRNLFEPLYNFPNGWQYFKYWKELEYTQYLPEEILRKKQWQRLISLLQHAYENSPFYRKRLQDIGLHPLDIKSLADIRYIPVLTKEEIRENMEKMIATGYRIESLLNFKTGGSTGKPLVIYMTEECSGLRNACTKRHDRWTGWEIGEPVGAVWGNPDLPKDLKSKLRNWLLIPRVYLDTMKLSKASVRAFAEDWDRIHPTLMFGHAHSIYLLALYVAEMDIASISPKGIITSSMMLIPNERKTIEDVFGKIVFDRYGCEELSLIASECEKHEGMHINIEHLLVEFLKESGEYTKSGEQGKIIVTDLMNKAMPFIRYEVGDIGIPLDKKCSCGRGLPLMQNISGRVADFLIKRDGTRVAGVSLIENTLTRIPGINQMQIIQESLDHIILNVVEGKDFNETYRRSLTLYFQKLFGDSVKIELNKVKNIKPEKSGKYRFSICNVKLNDQDFRL